MLFKNPLIWLVRFRHRRGYGVHSPFAFEFITDVLYQRGEYYAYKALSEQYYSAIHRALDLLPLQQSRLLFRLVNYCHPKRMLLLGASEADATFMREACPTARIVGESSDEIVDFAFLNHPSDRVVQHRLHAGSMLVLANLQRHQDWWKQLMKDEQVGITFDLYYLGVAFFDREKYKQHYIVNW